MILNCVYACGYILGESDMGNERENVNTDSDIPLYPGAPITTKVLLLLLLAFVGRHKLSKEATNDLLYIVNLVCPKPNNCCITVYKFRKLFSGLQLPTTFHYYCPPCLVSINYPTIKVCEICSMAFSAAKLPVILFLYQYVIKLNNYL